MSNKEQGFDKKVEKEMEERVENFLGALKDPTKRLTPDPNVKHDVHMVDVEGFDPTAKIHVEDENEEADTENTESPKPGAA